MNEKTAHPAKRILVTAAGGSPATNFVRSLREAPESFHLIGTDCNKYALQRAETDERYLVPRAEEPDYLPVLLDILQGTKTEFLYPQMDPEIAQISRHREEIPTRLLLPRDEVIQLCQNKFELNQRWKNAGLRVPKTFLVRDERSLEEAFTELGSPVWICAIWSSGAGQGSLKTESVEMGKHWIHFCQGWGKFTAAECLEPHSTTWSSIWWNGRLVVAQGRRRLYWELANRAPSGVTGITGTGVTVSDPQVDEIAQQAVRAVDKKPHGIFSVDLTYDRREIPNPTEINIGRFFTTHHFFTRAGLNLPLFLVRLAFGETLPPLDQVTNPLRPGLAWVRGVDFLPVLTDLDRIETASEELHARKSKLGLVTR